MERYNRIGVKHFLLMLSQPCEHGEIRRFAEDVIAQIH